MPERDGEKGTGYRLRYGVAAVAMSRLCPSRLGWWLLNRRMFRVPDSGRTDGSDA